MKLLNTLFEITIYSAVLFAAVTGFKLAFKNKLSPALHFTLWFLVIARLCIPMTIESGFHLFTVEQEKPLVQQQIPEVSAFDAPTPAATREAAPSEALHSEAPAPVQEPLPAADSPKPVFTIASADALIALWVAGMAFRAAALLFGERRLHLAMAHNTLPTDARTRDIYDACCAELGIAHKLPLQSMAGIYSPALTVGLKPMILLPANITDTLSEAQLAYALRHELMHYRRRDHLLALLLLLLTCVYWFNPIVWLMKRELMKDMETACDSAVTARLNGTERREYAMTLLALFSQPCRANSVLGMALSPAENDAERRVREVFGAHRSKAPVKILAALLSALLLACCFTTACQPTPEKEIVVVKSDGAMDAVIAATTAPDTQKFSAPSHYTDSGTFYNGMLNLALDMDVIIPDVERYPVYEAFPSDFTQEQVDSIVYGLFKDAPLIFDDQRETKQDILEKYLLPAQKKLERMRQSAQKDNIADLEGSIELYKQWYDAAPEKGDEYPITSGDYSKMEQFSAKADLGKARPATLHIDKLDNNGFSRGLEFVNGVEYIYNAFHEPTDDIDIKTTRNEAVAIATQLVKDMGADDFVFAAVGKTTRLGNEFSIYSDEYQSVMAYSVVFTREIDGIPFRYCAIDRPGSKADDAVRSSPPPYERIMVIVDDSGVANVFWIGNTRIGKQLNENVVLLPFEEIAERAMNQLKVQYAFLADEKHQSYAAFKTESIDLLINRAELSYMRVRMKNSDDYMLIPVWHFFGISTLHFDPEGVEAFNRANKTDIKSLNVTDFPYIVYLSLNAIDGSVIDINLGY